MHEPQHNEQWWKTQNISKFPLHLRPENKTVATDSDKEHSVTVCSWIQMATKWLHKGLHNLQYWQHKLPTDRIKGISFHKSKQQNVHFPPENDCLFIPTSFLSAYNSSGTWTMCSRLSEQKMLTEQVRFGDILGTMYEENAAWVSSKQRKCAVAFYIVQCIEEQSERLQWYIDISNKIQTSILIKQADLQMSWELTIKWQTEFRTSLAEAF